MAKGARELIRLNSTAGTGHRRGPGPGFGLDPGSGLHRPHS